eukprot:scaffold267752_cov39-Tisochrysis_lutea.AAC.1
MEERARARGSGVRADTPAEKAEHSDTRPHTSTVSMVATVLMRLRGATRGTHTNRDGKSEMYLSPKSRRTIHNTTSNTYILHTSDR